MTPSPELLRAAAAADEADLDAVLINDVYFHRSPFTLLGALSRETHRVKLGTNVTNPFVRHPVDLASQIATVNELESRLEDVRTPMDVAIIGCIVNGPGEAREAHIGLTGASPNNLVYVSGKPDHKVTNDTLVDHLEAQIRERAKDLETEREVSSVIAKAQ